MFNYQPWREHTGPYEDWLAKQGEPALDLWKKRLLAPDGAEGAVAEAVTWVFLRSRVDSIDLLDIPGAGPGSPDFLCHQSGVRFLVEVTNISSTAATKVIRSGSGGFSNYVPLTTQILNKVQKKADTKKKNIEHPLVVFVTTLHFDMGRMCVRRLHLEELLLGESSFVQEFETATGAPRGDSYVCVSLDRTAFAQNDSLVDARQNISAVVVGGFGAHLPVAPVLGVLHPNAHRPFDPSLLPCVPFGARRVNAQKESAFVEWSDGKSSD